LPLNDKSDSEIYQKLLSIRLSVGDSEEIQPLKNSQTLGRNLLTLIACERGKGWS